MSALPLASAVDTFWSVMEVAVPLTVAALYLKRANSLADEGRPVA